MIENPVSGSADTSATRESASRLIYQTLPIVLFVSKQAGDAGDKDRAEQPSGDYLRPQVVKNQRASEPYRHTKRGTLSRSLSVGPPVVLLMEIDERKKHIERVQERVQNFVSRVISGSIFRIGRAHHARLSRGAYDEA